MLANEGQCQAYSVEPNGGIMPIQTIREPQLQTGRRTHSLFFSHAAFGMRLSARCASRPPLAQHPFRSAPPVMSFVHPFSPSQNSSLSRAFFSRVMSNSPTHPIPMSAASALRLSASLHLTHRLYLLFTSRLPTNEDTFGGCLTHTCSIDDNQGPQLSHWPTTLQPCRLCITSPC